MDAQVHTFIQIIVLDTHDEALFLADDIDSSDPSMLDDASTTRQRLKDYERMSDSQSEQYFFNL